MTATRVFSFADAIASIAASHDLPEQKRRHWTDVLAPDRQRAGQAA